MRIRVKGAEESYAGDYSDAKKNLDAMLAAKSLAELDKACADAKITIPPRAHLPFAYVAYPINKEHYAVVIVGMNASTYDVFPLYAYSLLRGVPLTTLKLINEVSTLPTAKQCLFYSKEEIVETLINSGLPQARALVDAYQNSEYSSTPFDVLKSIVHDFSESDQDAIGLSGLEPYEIEDALPDIQKKLKLVFDTMMADIQSHNSQTAVPTSQTTNSTTSATSGTLTVDAAVQQMRQKGGEMTVNGKTGYVVEIFYDYNAGKLRARTNDGQNGLMNARFPQSYRERDAVFVVPKWQVTLANKCYAISNNVPLANYRVR